jgi:hypothetical protein
LKIGASPCKHGICSRTGADGVRARAGTYDVVTAASLDLIPSSERDDHVAVRSAGELVVTVRADDRGALSAAPSACLR